MYIARWHYDARFGHKAEAIALHEEWDREVGSQTGIDLRRQRTVTGSVGTRESHVEVEFEIEGLGELQAFFDKIATIRMHEEWGRKMSEVIVSGSTYWEVLRVVD